MTKKMVEGCASMDLDVYTKFSLEKWDEISLFVRNSPPIGAINIGIEFFAYGYHHEGEIDLTVSWEREETDEELAVRLDRNKRAAVTRAANKKKKLGGKKEELQKALALVEKLKAEGVEA